MEKKDSIGEVRKMISGLKYCPNWNKCNRRRCQKDDLVILLDESKMNFDYVKAVMQEHDINLEELEVLLSEYRKSSEKIKDDSNLYKKLGEIYSMFNLKKTYLEDITPDNCPLN